MLSGFNTSDLGLGRLVLREAHKKGLELGIAFGEVSKSIVSLSLAI